MSPAEEKLDRAQGREAVARAALFEAALGYAVAKANYTKNIEPEKLGAAEDALTAAAKKSTNAAHETSRCQRAVERERG